MKIPNPWPYHALSRCTCKTSKDEVVCVGSTRDRELEVPEADEVLIEPVKQAGRGVVVPVGQGRIWSKKWGLLDLEDHLKKMKIEEEEAELKAKQKKQQKRDEKPARVIDEKPARVVSEKPIVADNSLSLGDELEL